MKVKDNGFVISLKEITFGGNVKQILKNETLAYDKHQDSFLARFDLEDKRKNIGWLKNCFITISNGNGKPEEFRLNQCRGKGWETRAGEIVDDQGAEINTDLYTGVARFHGYPHYLDRYKKPYFKFSVSLKKKPKEEDYVNI